MWSATKSVLFQLGVVVVVDDDVVVVDVVVVVVFIADVVVVFVVDVVVVFVVDVVASSVRTAIICIMWCAENTVQRSHTCTKVLRV